jgi:uncharacterized protein (DUF3084 family)
MGRALAILLHGELASVADENLETLHERLLEREAAIEAERVGLKAAHTDLEQRTRDLIVREAEIAERERDVTDRENNVAAVEHGLAEQLKTLARTTPTVRPQRKPGRNEPCWCGSERKYKVCHLSQDS